MNKGEKVTLEKEIARLCSEQASRDENRRIYESKRLLGIRLSWHTHNLLGIEVNGNVAMSLKYLLSEDLLWELCNFISEITISPPSSWTSLRH